MNWNTPTKLVQNEDLRCIVELSPGFSMLASLHHTHSPISYITIENSIKSSGPSGHLALRIRLGLRLRCHHHTFPMCFGWGIKRTCMRDPLGMISACNAAHGQFICTHMLGDFFGRCWHYISHRYRSDIEHLEMNGHITYIHRTT